MFKETFKYYKAKWPTPNLNNVVDIDAAINIEDVGNNVHLLQRFVLTTNNELTQPHGLQPVHTWQCYTLPEHPGLLIIRNPFTVRGQRYWMARCLRDYPRQPNVVNLNAHLFTPAAIADWWRELQNCKDKDEARRLKIAMRWTTLGYHHDWNTKVYSETMHTQFPHDLSELCQYFANILGYYDFRAEAAIVNYYPIGTTLAGHTDHSEQNLTAPLFSFSFGQTAIFLIGGPTKESRPTALYLRSGDLLVMSQQSRLCYHAVPRIMKARQEPWNELITETMLNEQLKRPLKKLRIDYDNARSNTDEDFDMSLYEQIADELFWQPYKYYFNDSRININVRQVLKIGQFKLETT